MSAVGIAVAQPSLVEGYYENLPLRDALHPQTLLAYAMNDRPLVPEHGAPLRSDRAVAR